ncbi:MAG: SidA/IucD/PvdA family monooxygenase [Gordonia sp. (in: high G+C Gram-positive bacteria)]
MTAQHIEVVLDAQESLRILGYSEQSNLIDEAPGTDHDVVVVGGGQSGITIAYALRSAGITRVSVIDAALDEIDLAFRATARMRTLRTAKTISGPELGVPALTFQVWYESVYGAGTFARIERIATTDWADYLTWFRAQVGISVRRGVRLQQIEPLGDGRLRLHLRDVHSADDLLAGHSPRAWTEDTRKVVLATGVSGTGGPLIPDVVRDLSSRVFAHTADRIDFSALKGKSVAVLGAAASAFDAAATALEAGAATVDIYSRRPELVVASAAAAPPNRLVQDVFHQLRDDERWRRRKQIADKGATVPADSVARVTAFAHHRIHLAATWRTATERDNRVIVDAADGVATFDFVIAGTGYQQDPATRPELASIAPHIARWRDVYVPPPGQESELLGAAPYLGSGYEFVERSVGTAPWLRDIHVFSIGANVSFGRPVGDIPSLRFGVPHLTAAITRDLVLADLARVRTAPVALR